MATIPPLILKDGPDPTADKATDVGKSEQSTYTWARNATAAIRSLYSTVKGLQNAPVATAAASPAAATSQQSVVLPGLNGWSPVLGLVSFMGKVIMQVVSWVGGGGNSPLVGQYLGPTGFVTDPNEALNLQGPAGVPGAGGSALLFNWSSTNAPPPAAGFIQAEAPSFGRTIKVDVSNLDVNGNDISAWFAQIGVNSFLYLYEVANPGNLFVFKVSNVTSHTGYSTFTGGGVSPVPFTAGLLIGLSFTPAQADIVLVQHVTSLLSGQVQTISYPSGGISPAPSRIRINAWQIPSSTGALIWGSVVQGSVTTTGFQIVMNADPMSVGALDWEAIA